MPDSLTSHYVGMHKIQLEKNKRDEIFAENSEILKQYNIALMNLDLNSFDDELNNCGTQNYKKEVEKPIEKPEYIIK